MRKLFAKGILLGLCVIIGPSIYSNQRGETVHKIMNTIVNERDSQPFYGKWIVKKFVDSPPVSMHDTDDINKSLNKEIEYSKSIARADGGLLKKPFYKKTILSKYDFEVGYKMNLKKLGIIGDKITQITVYTDKTCKKLWDNTGNVFFVKNKNVLILWNIECYEMVRKH